MLVGTGRQQDHGHIAGLTDASQHRKPVGRGQHHIEHHQRRAVGIEPAQRLQAIADLVHRVAVTLEVPSHDLPHHRLVVHHQHRGVAAADVIHGVSVGGRPGRRHEPYRHTADNRASPNGLENRTHQISTVS